MVFILLQLFELFEFHVVVYINKRIVLKKQYKYQSCYYFCYFYYYVFYYFPYYYSIFFIFFLFLFLFLLLILTFLLSLFPFLLLNDQPRAVKGSLHKGGPTVLQDVSTPSLIALLAISSLLLALQ